MEENKKNQQQESSGNDPDEFTDGTTKNKIDRHLHDVNDTISEKDIKNINTDISSGEIPGAVEKKNQDKDEKDEQKEDKDQPKDEMPTSWDILE